MTIADTLHLLGPADWAALALLALGWFGIARLIEHPLGGRPSTSALMRSYRQDWMRELVTRQPRIFDSAILSTLRQGTTFFASSTMIAIGGGLALVGNPQAVRDVASDLALETSPEIVWELKILLILLFLTAAFLNFVWSHRLFGYCAVMMASVPNDPEDPRAYPRAAKAAEINTLAARSFNRGMRAVYFALGSTGWLLGAIPLMLGTLAVLLLVGRREFAARSRDVLLRPDT